MAVHRYLITAGPTREPIDAVRYLANRSSGAMGIALAEAAVSAGHDVTLLLGPTERRPDPAAVEQRRLIVEHFTTTAELARLLEAHFPRCEVLVMAAAVADYTPVQTHAEKLPRGAAMTLPLQPTRDLVADCAATRRSEQRIVGFALEAPAHLHDRSRKKLTRKGLDAIVANPLDTMGQADVDATVYAAGGGQGVTPGAMSKPAFARWLVAWIDHTLMTETREDAHV